MGNHTLLIRKDKIKVPVADSAAPLKDSAGKVIGCVVVFRDVEEERRVDQAKTEFVSLASHQLRTPLATIKWYIEMLIGGDAGKINDEQKKYLQEVYIGNERMVELVNALLNVSRIELGTFAVEPKKVSIVGIAKDVVHELSLLISEKKIKINEKYDKKIGDMSLDPRLMHMVFQNLLSNSVKYTPSGGQVDIEIKTKNDDVFVMVKDTGYGIPKKDQKQIFTKMFRADNIKEKDATGTGLGLYIVKSIVEKSAGGKIWFESVKDEGTTFYFTIPRDGMKKKTGSKTLS
jgi:signal transduction histidine kinase